MPLVQRYVFPVGEQRLVHVIAKNLQSNLRNGTDLPLIGVRLGTVPHVQIAACHDIEIKGPSWIRTEKDRPLPGTDGRAICVLKTYSELVLSKADMRRIIHPQDTNAASRPTGTQPERLSGHCLEEVVMPGMSSVGSSSARRPTQMPARFPRPQIKVRCIQADRFGHLRVGQTYKVIVVVKKWADRLGEHEGLAYILEGVKCYAWDATRFERAE